MTWSSTREELKPMLRLAIPLVLAELGWMAMGIVDTMFVGRVSAEAIGAVGLGAMMFYGIAMCTGGVLLGLDTLVSQSFGARDLDDCRRSLASGLWLAAFLIPIVMALVWGCEQVLASFGIDPTVLDATRPYMRVLNWSTAPLFVFFALRRYLQAIHVARPVMVTLVTANLVNLAGNWILVLGNLGAPRLGAEGAAWATCISRVYMAAALMLVVVRRDGAVIGMRWRPDTRRIKELFWLGLPTGAQMGVEIGVFAVVTVLAGRLSALALAANQIALTTVSTTYMMPLGISSAAAVRVGHALGRGDREGAARSGGTALMIGAAAMSAAAVTLLAVPRWFARAFTPEPPVIAAAAVLLQVAAFFQLFDGFQVVATGALRGAGDTRTPMLCHFAGYWLIGLPLGAILCFRAGLGVTGLWIGLSTGLILIGIVLLVFWRRAARRIRTSGRNSSGARTAGDAESLEARAPGAGGSEHPATKWR